MSPIGPKRQFLRRNHTSEVGVKPTCQDSSTDAFDPHRTPASRLRPTAIAVSELLTAALAGPAQILMMY